MAYVNVSSQYRPYSEESPNELFLYYIFFIYKYNLLYILFSKYNKLIMLI